MKKDFYWAIGCTMMLLIMARSSINTTVVAWRTLAYYLVYPTTQTLLSAFRYAGYISGSWRELLAARYYWEQFQDEERQRNLEALDALVVQRQEQLSFDLESQKDYLKAHPTIFGALAYPVIISQRMLGEQGWSSRACSSALPDEVSDLSPVYQLLKDRSMFVLAGHVIGESAGRSSQSCYELITSQQHRVSVSVGSTGEIALLRGLGRPDRMILEYLPKQSAVQVGDEIRTASSSSLYPPGIPIGVVEGVVSPTVTQMFAQAYVKPYLELGHLETVVVIPWSNKAVKGAANRP